MSKEADKAVREFLARAGKRGGRSRARMYDKATLSKWGRKGGRPRKQKKG
jgi:general stress protein YciG